MNEEIMQPTDDLIMKKHSNSESQWCKRQQRNLSNIILRPTEAVIEQTENSKATLGLGHGTHNAEERFRWSI